MNTPTPMLDLIYNDNPKLLEVAKAVYQLYNVTEMEASNFVSLAAIAGRKQDLSVLEEALKGMQRRTKPLD